MPDLRFSYRRLFLSAHRQSIHSLFISFHIVAASTRFLAFLFVAESFPFMSIHCQFYALVFGAWPLRFQSNIRPGHSNRRPISSVLIHALSVPLFSLPPPISATPHLAHSVRCTSSLCQFHTIHVFATSPPFPITSFPCHLIAFLCRAMPFHIIAIQLAAESFPRYSTLRLAYASQFHAIHLFAISCQCLSPLCQLI